MLAFYNYTFVFLYFCNFVILYFCVFARHSQNGKQEAAIKKGGTTRPGSGIVPHFMRVVLKKSVFLYLLRPKRSFMPSRSKPRVKRMVWSKGLVWLVLKT